MRDAVIEAGGKQLRVAVVNGLKNAAPVCEEVKAGKSPYAAIEVMSCPGGCVNGGGQPYADWNSRNQLSAVSSMLKLKNWADGLINT